MDISKYICPDEYADEHEPEMRPSKELDFVNHWLERSIPSEISRGASLRHVKSGSKRDACHVAGLSVDKEAPYYDCKSRHSKKPTKYSSLRRSKRSPISSRSLSPARTVVSYKKALSRSCTPKRTPKRCPLRIAELAQPSKRQCLETWRTRGHALPTVMVERLKQIVMDQKTIAHIPDAIECFRVAKRNNRRSKKANSICESRKQSPQRMEYLRHFCAVFGHRIANQMIAPRNIVLNSELQKLSQVVHNEITCISKGDGLFYARRNATQNKKIQKEMSDKITVWIASVLQDSDDKLLEDELRVKKLQEVRRLFQEDCYETLIGSQAQIGVHIENKLKQLEEEEGPVLDILDELVYNVVGMCHKVDVMTDSDAMKEYFDDAISPENLSISSYGTGNSKKTPTVEGEQKDEDVEGEMTDGDENQQDYDENRQESHDNISGGIAESSPFASINPINSTSSIDADEVNNKLFVDNTRVIDRKNTEETIKTLLNNIIDQANVSEVYVVIDEEPQEQNRTVKFTDLDVVNGKSVDTNFMSKMLSEGPSNMFKQEPKKPFQRPNIANLAQPNENLLSDADESWPAEDIISPTLRASQSVSKSITSLGKIFEDETESHNESPEESGIEETVSALHVYDDLYDQEDLSQTPLIHGTHGIVSVEITVQTSKVKTNDQQDNTDLEDIQSSSPDDEEKQGFDTPRTLSPISRKSSKEHKSDSKTIVHGKRRICACFKDIGKGDNTEIDEKNAMFVALPPKVPTKVSYKVNPKTAPSWVLSSQSSEDSLISQLNVKNKQMSCIARKWAAELDRAFSTLEQWNLWMESTCRKVTFLKQREVGNKMFSSKNAYEDYNDWIKFKSSIDKDVTLWKKLNSNLEQKFNVVQSKFKLMREWKDKSNALYKSSIIRTINEFDRLCSWTHRMIVSGEYNVKCNCRNKYESKSAKTRRVCQPNTSKY